MVGNRVSISICTSSPCELCFVHTFGVNFPKGFSYMNVQWQSLLFQQQCDNVAISVFKPRGHATLIWLL